MKGKTVLLMIVSTLAFAVVNALVKYLEDYGEFQLVFFRCIVSLLISLIQLKALRISVWGNNKLILIIARKGNKDNVSRQNLRLVNEKPLIYYIINCL